MVEFEWDDGKAETNFKKHGVRFSEAFTIWLDGDSLEMHDPDHSSQEDRWLRIGHSTNARVLVVVYCERLDSDRIRIISARKATKQEQKQYYAR